MVVTRGFSLIEMLVTLALIAMLLISALPLTSSWVNSANQREASNVMTQGISRAKAIALRNPSGVGLDAAAVALCIDDSIVSLVLQSKDQPFTCTPDDADLNIWSAVLPSSVSVKDEATTLRCLALDNRGLLLTVSDCAASSIIAIRVLAGNEDALEVPVI